MVILLLPENSLQTICKVIVQLFMYLHQVKGLASRKRCFVLDNNLYEIQYIYHSTVKSSDKKRTTFSTMKKHFNLPSDYRSTMSDTNVFHCNQID